MTKSWRPRRPPADSSSFLIFPCFFSTPFFFVVELRILPTSFPITLPSNFSIILISLCFRFCFDFCFTIIMITGFVRFSFRCFFKGISLHVYCIRGSYNVIFGPASAQITKKHTQLLEQACYRWASTASTAQRKQLCTKQQNACQPIRVWQRKQADRVSESQHVVDNLQLRFFLQFFLWAFFFSTYDIGSFVHAYFWTCFLYPNHNRTHTQLLRT